MSADDRLKYWQRRALIAEGAAEWAKMPSRCAHGSVKKLDRERFLSDRCSFLYTEARQRGATIEELATPELRDLLHLSSTR